MLTPNTVYPRMKLKRCISPVVPGEQQSLLFQPRRGGVMAAQDVVLGKVAILKQALKGCATNQTLSLVRPFRAWGFGGDAYLGLRPGLSKRALSGLL